MTQETWYIYGAGGLGRETMDILRHAIDVGAVAPHQLAFLEDGTAPRKVDGLLVLDPSQCTAGAKVTIAVGEPAIRRILWDKALALGLMPANVISPTAFVSPTARLGRGITICPQCSIQSQAQLDDNAHINTLAIIGHDIHIGAHGVISSMVNLGGAVVVGAESYVGMGALVKEGLTIGARSIIGMGSVVYKDVPDDVIALGNPARVARRNEDQRVFKKTKVENDQ